jgi:hypothetical protein
VKRLVVLTVVAIAVLTGGLALYLFWLGSLLNRIATNAEESADLVGRIDGDAKVIRPGVARINRIAGVVAGALPLLYSMAEQIVRSAAPPPAAAPQGGDQGQPRRSRQQGGVGYIPPTGP